VSNALQFTDRQLTTIIGSLQSSIRRAEEKAIEALKKDFHDAKVEEAFYVDLKARCEETLAVISASLECQAEDEDTCHECGEGEGFCQCEEDDQ
jgi:hypothetical protein